VSALFAIIGGLVCGIRNHTRPRVDGHRSSSMNSYL
jgi:hypothetical protein